MCGPQARAAGAGVPPEGEWVFYESVFGSNFQKNVTAHTAWGQFIPLWSVRGRRKKTELVRVVEHSLTSPSICLTLQLEVSFTLKSWFKVSEIGPFLPFGNSRSGLSQISGPRPQFGGILRMWNSQLSGTLPGLHTVWAWCIR